MESLFSWYKQHLKQHFWQNISRHVNSVAVDLPDDFMEEL